jgi:hypothetical protein
LIARLDLKRGIAERESAGLRDNPA